MKTLIVLAMHGMPPKDFPLNEKIEFFKLHSQLEAMKEKMPGPLIKRHDDLETKMRNWPRTIDNDPYQATSIELSEYLKKEIGYNVYVGYNEFCSPTLEEALEKAASQTPDNIVVITPMMTRGGEHSEIDIPAAIERTKKKFKKMHIKYIWPFETIDIAKFLADQIRRSI